MKNAAAAKDTGAFSGLPKRQAIAKSLRTHMALPHIARRRRPTHGESDPKALVRAPT
eukprot:CAMPEP_0176166446 /NCGR_PEP_ID=MMETSP0120_2-20121206/85128_1 /TAXON_ID=160619 /ORGANISM="Kryptoperidinium foliaceum, Strain CCMP 1326" /LENGTH=56 /DNA_ID=CAMNT_0017503989 /DNA_START=178 /DNA_END=344 /DNA_ORIENTATION=-